jgi:hypothetical protein
MAQMSNALFAAIGAIIASVIGAVVCFFLILCIVALCLKSAAGRKNKTSAHVETHSATAVRPTTTDSSTTQVRKGVRTLEGQEVKLQSIVKIHRLTNHTIKYCMAVRLRFLDYKLKFKSNKALIRTTNFYHVGYFTFMRTAGLVYCAHRHIRIL